MGTMLKDFFKTLHEEIDCWRYEILENVFHLSAIMEQEWSRHSAAAIGFEMYLYFFMLGKEEAARGTLTVENKDKYLELKKDWLKRVEETVNKLRIDDRSDYLQTLLLCEAHDALDRVMNHYKYQYYSDFKSNEIIPFIDRMENGLRVLSEVDILVTGSKRHLRLEVLE